MASSGGLEGAAFLQMTNLSRLTAETGCFKSPPDCPWDSGQELAGVLVLGVS